MLLTKVKHLDLHHTFKTINYDYDVNCETIIEFCRVHEGNFYNGGSNGSKVLCL